MSTPAPEALLLTWECQLREWGLQTETAASSLTVPSHSADGYDATVAFRNELGDWVVAFGELWHRHFEHPAEAIRTFAEGLTPSSVLSERRRLGTTVARWGPDEEVTTPEGSSARNHHLSVDRLNEATEALVGSVEA